MQTSKGIKNANDFRQVRFGVEKYLVIQTAIGYQYSYLSYYKTKYLTLRVIDRFLGLTMSYKTFFFIDHYIKLKKVMLAKRLKRKQL